MNKLRDGEKTQQKKRRKSKSNLEQSKAKRKKGKNQFNADWFNMKDINKDLAGKWIEKVDEYNFRLDKQFNF